MGEEVEAKGIGGGGGEGEGYRSVSRNWRHFGTI